MVCLCVDIMEANGDSFQMEASFGFSTMNESTRRTHPTKYLLAVVADDPVRKMRYDTAVIVY